MPLEKKSNGLPQQDGPLSDQSSPFRPSTRQPTSLGFATSRDSLSAKRDHHLSLHDRWDRGHQHQREVLRHYLAAKDRAPVFSVPAGAIFMALLLFLSLSMAFFVLQNEEKLLEVESRSEKIK